MKYAKPTIVKSPFGDRLVISYPYVEDGDWIHKDDHILMINKAIDEYKQIQMESGSKDSYGQGIYNGMEFVRATLTDDEPKYIDKRFKVKE